MATFAKGEQVRIQSSGKYGGLQGEIVKYDEAIDRAGGYPYTVRFGSNYGAFKASNLQKIDPA